MKNIFLLTTAVALFCFIGCNKNESIVNVPMLTFNDTAIVFPITGGSKVTAISQYTTDSTASWTVSPAGKDPIPGWLTIVSPNPMAGKGKNTTQLSLSATENTAVPGAVRGITLVLKSSNPNIPPVLLKISQLYDPNFDITAKLTDAIFKAACVTKWSNGHTINITQAAAADSINISGSNIANLNGLNYFSNLTYLNCSAITNAAFTTIDATKNPALQTLICSNNTKLKTIDISKDSTALTTLNCSNCPALTTIYVWTTFDVNNPPAGFIIPVTATYVVKQ